MATKDWTKVIDASFEQRWDNGETEERITMLKHRNGWDIFIFGESEIAKIRKDNLTKSQAISFAKSYMRTH
jgi:hypothetical protein